MKMKTMMMALLMLLLAGWAAAASPSYNQSWSEQPWLREAAAELPAGETVLSSPISINISDREPQAVLLAGEAMNVSQLANAATPSLWIDNGTAWSRSRESAAGEAIDIIACTAEGANADLYLISYSNGSIKHYNYRLQEGYSLLRLVPAETGRIFLIMVSSGEPAGSVMLDVLPKEAKPSATPPDLGNISIGESLITIKSERFQGYDVYVDGVFFASDGSDGNLDGTARVTVGSDKTHDIAIWQRDGQGGFINKSVHTRVFKRDVAYTLLIR